MDIYTTCISTHSLSFIYVSFAKNGYASYLFFVHSQVSLDFFHDKPLYFELVLIYRIGLNNDVSICLDFALSCFVCFPTHLLSKESMHYNREGVKRGMMYTIEIVITLHMLEHVAK